MIGALSWKVKAAVGLMFLLVSLWAGIATRKAYDYNREVNGLVDAIRIAAREPRLERPDAALQVHELGQSLRTVTDKLDQCADRVRDLHAASESARREADVLLSRGADRAAQARTAAGSLEQSARQPPTGRCLSDEVKERWK